MSVSLQVLAMGSLGLVAGGINALAGGGPIIVVAALAALGLPANVASLTSTVALLPGQVASITRGVGGTRDETARGWAMRIALVAILGGATGAILLLHTPAGLFADLLPWLILFATGLYAWHSREPADRPLPARAASRYGLVGWLCPLAVYGGFYGGGNSFLVLALLAAYGLGHRAGAHAKNRIILLINAAASGVFLYSGKVDWAVAWPLATGALVGGWLGAQAIDRIDTRMLRRLVIAIGVALAAVVAIRG